MYYILFKDLKTRTMFIDYLKQNDISSVFHYIPLHSAPAGQKFGRTGSDMRVTDIVSDTLVRLPLYYELTDMDLDYIFNCIENFFGRVL